MCLFETYLRLHEVISLIPNRCPYPHVQALVTTVVYPTSCYTHEKAYAHRRHPVHDLIFKYKKKHGAHVQVAEQDGWQREHGK